MWPSSSPVQIVNHSFKNILSLTFSAIVTLFESGHVLIGAVQVDAVHCMLSFGAMVITVRVSKLLSAVQITDYFCSVPFGRENLSGHSTSTQLNSTQSLLYIIRRLKIGG